MSVNGKIDDTGDFTPNGLMQLKLWLDPWFRNKAKGAGLPVPPWTVDYDTGEVTGTTYPDGDGTYPTTLQLHAETADSTTLDPPLAIVVTAGDAQTLSGILGDWTVGDDVSLDANEVKLVGGDSVTATAYEADMTAGASAALIGVDCDPMVGGEGSSVTGFRADIDVADFGQGRGLDVNVEAADDGASLGVKVRTRSVDGDSTGVLIDSASTGAGVARSIVATGTAQFNDPVEMIQQAEFAPTGAAVAPADFPTAARVYNIDNGDGTYDLCCDVSGGDVVVLATG